MNYDIGFKVKVEGVDYWVEPMYCDANVTWNVREIIERSTGLDWLNEANNGLCSDVIPYIEHGVKELTEHPDKYKKYESKIDGAQYQVHCCSFKPFCRTGKDLKVGIQNLPQ